MRKISIQISELIMIFWYILSYCFSYLGEISEPTQIFVFVLNNLVLFYYVYSVGIKGLAHEGNISLSLLFVIFQFGVQVCIGNLSLFWGEQRANSGWEFLNKSMTISILGCLCMGLSMRSKAFYTLGNQLRNKFIRNGDDYQTSIITIPLFIISFIAFLYAMRIGIYGYADSSNLTASIDYASSAQYIIYIADLGNLIALISFYIGRKYQRQKEKILAIVFIIARAALALMSGMKKELIAIAVCIFFIDFFIQKKVSKKSVFLIVITVVVGYVFIEAYRAALRAGVYSGNRLSLLLYVFQNSSGSLNVQDGSNSFIYDFLARLNITEACSAIVKYKDLVGLQTGDPTFLLDLILLPITIFVPRSLMPFKSMSTYGLWVTHTVLGMPSSVYSASYVTVQGFFYLAGGLLCVAIGFWLMTQVLEFISGFFADFDNPVMIGAFLMITYKVIIEPSTPVAVITSAVRGLIIYTIFGMCCVRAIREEHE